MRGIILAGGYGKRLHPLTLIANKHLLPIYDRPMILFPLETLKRAGIDRILVVCIKEHAHQFMHFLGSGKDHGVKINYELQHGAGGIAEALSLAEEFANGEKTAVILGDNVFEDDFSKEVKEFEKQKGAKVFLKEVENPYGFGIAELEGGKIVNLAEKPNEPKSNLAVTGFYLYDPDVFEKIKTIKPSWRDELEITDVNARYLQEGNLSHGFVKGFWSDAGTIENLHKTSAWAAEQKKKQQKQN